MTTTHLDAPSSSALADTPVRTYGGWRVARGMGLFGLGAASTGVVLACALTPMMLAAFSLRAGGLALVPAALVAALTMTRIGGVTIGHLVLRRTGWWWAVARGWNVRRATTIDQHPKAWELPGVLAPTRLISAPDGRGGTFGIVWNRRTGTLTATLRCAASSTWLVDTADADGWVHNWHAWLASLGYHPMIRSVAVTVETSPEPGTTLQDAVLPAIDPAAPDDVQALMRELVQRSPAASANIDTRVSITFDPARSPRRLVDLDDAAAEVSRQLAGLESSLGTCGVSVLGRATAAQLAAIVRIAFDPASRGDVERHLAQVEAAVAGGVVPVEPALEWAEAGPLGAVEEWDRYRHDSGVSVTWGWQEAPRQQVTSGVLSRLLSPARYTKRVTLLYRPLPAGEAARILEAQVNAAAFRDAYRRAQKRDETARDVADRAQARQAAAEEAQGAGVVLMSLYVTATVTDEADLDEAIADINSRADQSKIRLRPAFGAQAETWAYSLVS